MELSVRAVEHVLAEEGFSKLARRSRLKLGLTVKGDKVSAISQAIAVAETVHKPDGESAGVFLFAPIIEKLNVSRALQSDLKTF